MEGRDGRIDYWLALGLEVPDRLLPSSQAMASHTKACSFPIVC